MAILKANTGIGITNPTSALTVVGDGLFTGIVTATAFSGTSSYAIVAGITTYATNAGVATYATNAGIATNLKGGSSGDIPYQSSTNTTSFISASSAAPGQVILWNGSNPFWGNVSGASGAFGGITVQDENVTVGTSGSITTLNFVSPNLSVTATSGALGIATIRTADILVGTGLSVAGIATAQKFSLSISSRNGIAGVNSTDGVTNIKAIRFDSTTGFGVTDLGDGEVFVDLGSSFNPWYVEGQPTLDAYGEEAITFVAGPGFAITTGLTVTGVTTGLTKSITFSPTFYWIPTTAGIHTLSNVGIGTTNPTQKLDVNGNIVASGTVTANSDVTLKTNIKTITNALEKVISLRGVEYDKIDSGEHQIGVIAQEVEQIIPEVVYPKGDYPDYEKKSVAYANLVALLIEAIKEQNQRIDELERRLGDL